MRSTACTSPSAAVSACWQPVTPPIAHPSPTDTCVSRALGDSPCSPLPVEAEITSLSYVTC
ncbi:hypothetical protein N657DRAFT_643488 [Parathielavia appendiculata]|uniref:Uncharacterized protein n=1 Tax=Parathielavia appendiculata TaxID=2587402 RepID=A0AAN6U235_9PEZI|nr:hypothetical protein N657DRAFT_643488 [Parathielavia appendiculata]